MDERQLTVREQGGELAVTDVIGQVRKIQEVMEAVMRKDEHYGTIPGCKKPSLYKPGAEKLGLTFRLAPHFEVDTITLCGNHREVRVKCSLLHIPTNTFVAEGVGSCSTMEAKYRYRSGAPEDTGAPVPVNYWDVRKHDPGKAQALLGGPSFVAKKIDGQWRICRKTESRVENEDIADTYNTVLKMAKKRAHVDAILTATAASDIFTQDLEDLPGVEVEEPNAELTPVPASGQAISDAQRKRLFAIFRDAKHHTEAQVREWLFVAYGINSSHEIPVEKYDEICTRLKDSTPLLPEDIPPFPPMREPGDDTEHERGFV
jgi:hypothetical protein